MTKDVENKKEMITYKLIDIIIKNLKNFASEFQVKIKEVGKIGEILLKIATNHLKKEKDLIQEGNKRRIVEYLMYSYNENIKTKFLQTFHYNSFPFSCQTISHIMKNISCFLPVKYYEELSEKHIFIFYTEVLNNFVDIIKIIVEPGLKKEIEKEKNVEWNDGILNQLKKEFFVEWEDSNFLFKEFYLYDLFSFNNNNINIIKRLIDLHCSHTSYGICFNKRELETMNEEIKEKALIKPFIAEEKNRIEFYTYFIRKFEYFKLDNIASIHYLINYSEGNVLGIYMKELTGEIVDRVKRGEGNDIRKERRE